MQQDVTPCPNCGSRTLYERAKIDASGGHGSDLLPGLSQHWYSSVKITVVVCRDCGLTRFFASPEARAKLKESRKWQPLTPSDRGGYR